MLKKPLRKISAPKAIPSKTENVDTFPNPPQTKRVAAAKRLNIETATLLKARDGFLLEKTFIAVLFSAHTKAEKNKIKYVEVVVIAVSLSMRENLS